MQCERVQHSNEDEFWHVELTRRDRHSKVSQSQVGTVNNSILTKVLKDIARGTGAKPLSPKVLETVELCFSSKQNSGITKEKAGEADRLDGRVARLWTKQFSKNKVRERSGPNKSEMGQEGAVRLFGSDQSHLRAENCLKRFVGAVRDNLADSVSFFEESGSVGAFERTLAEVREVIDMEFMRLNTLSESSGEDSGPDMEMFRSRTESTQNGFNLASEGFGARARINRDFHQMRSQIESSLNELNQRVQTQVASFASEFKDVSNALFRNLTENKKRVSGYFGEFEIKMDEWASELGDSSVGNNALKVAGNSQKNLDFISLMNKERGFTFGNQMQRMGMLFLLFWKVEIQVS